MTKFDRNLLILPVLWALPAILLLPWILDREPPYQVLSVKALAPAAPGEWLLIMKRVARRPGDCNLNFTRFIVDSDSVIYWIDSGYMSSSNRNKLPPESSNTGFVIPPPAAVGPAILYTDLVYRCNPLHEVWPIRTSEVVPFEVRAR